MSIHNPSVKRGASRHESLPPLLYNSALPIMTRKDDIVRAIRENRVTIITGETGSGKTTQIPKMCLEAGRGTAGLIGCTQPRRVAAVTVAHRLAEELKEEVGRHVGYKIRFDEKIGPSSLIKIMTDGILLVETQSDRLLRRYDTIIVDEAHERSLNIDFVLGILKSLLPRRPDLKVIITSATLDTEKFSRAFGDAPIIEVSGRMYPVDIQWHPLDPILEESGELTYIDGAVNAVDRIRAERQTGDILIFMPTEQDIWETCEILQGRYGEEVSVLPLFARLPWNEQRRVFQPALRPKIIVATNVAETSITIPDIRYVIDTGLARISQYNPRSRSSSLPIRPISRSSADQRKGRCGRVRHGVCIRLFSEEDYQGRPLHMPPEILRSNLAGVILQMLLLNLGDVVDFPFVDRPAKKNIADAIDLLQELGALQKEGKDAAHSRTHPYILTARGKTMARLPIDPRVARVILEGREQGCPEEVAIIASALSIVDPRERPADKRTQAEQMHAPFKDPTSDFMTLLRIWSAFHRQLEELKTQNRMRKFCRDHFLSYKRMREWRDVYKQITQILSEEEQEKALPPPLRRLNDLHPAIHKSILSGYLGNIAEKKEKNVYRAAKGREPMIFPGSSLYNRAGGWIVCAEMVETSRLYARIVANIEPAWIEEVGKDLCRSTYADPHWEKSREDVVACECVTLFGLAIIPGRTVSISRIHPEEASPIFIRQGLMPGELKSSFPFLRHNLALIERLQDMENKVRRHDLIDEEAIFRFYAERLPPIASVSSLRKWLQKRGTDDVLFMKEYDILRQPPDPETLSAYPEHMLVGGVPLPLSYRFEPGQFQDGVTLRIPSGLLSSLSVTTLDWAVPGLLREKVYGLLKSLPREFRKKLPPLPHLCDLMMTDMSQSEGSLLTAMGRFIQDRYGVAVPVSAWPVDQLSDHLKMLVVVVDGKERVLSSSRNIRDLQQNLLAGEESAALERARREWEKTGFTAWICGDLPETVVLQSAGSSIGFAYPALQAADAAVNLRLFKDKAAALTAHLRGVGRLYEFLFREDLKYLRKTLTLSGEWKDWALAFGGVKSLEKLLFDKVLHDLLDLPIRTEAEFTDHAALVRKRLIPRGTEVLRVASPVVEACFTASRTLDRLEKANLQSPLVRQFIVEIRRELQELVPANFLQIYAEDRLPDILRYLRALALRAERGLFHLEKAMAKTADVKVYQQKLIKLREGLRPYASAQKVAEVENLAWMIEEYKISLFAQELKTPYPISKKRLDVRIEEIEMME